MNEKILLEAVVLAGEIMLVSGAEVYRVEDTMNHMLKCSSYETTETVVFSTGIFVTLDDPVKETMTLIKRTPGRSTNINRIYLVNEISRSFCHGDITVEEAYEKLKETATAVQYGPWYRAVGLVGVPFCFAPIFGGNLLECVASGLVGVALAFADRIVKKVRLNDFCINAFCAFTVAVAALMIKNWLWQKTNVDVLIISSIMPLVPGVIFTTAIRDTLNGDYTSGSARMLEAVVTSLAVAAGVGGGMFLFQSLWGGILW
ncbi:MAG: threonine/serine exporter family protein [Lachnospiraceae bacterium]|nr:threonine/serine exporter family protein [Lachnospiraceae bacterium]